MVLQASQMQGFFGKPVDNLYAEPLIARWIQRHVPNWREAVVVSKNPGGTKRVTSLADVLKLNFGIVTTDKRRGNMSASMSASMSLEGMNGGGDDGDEEAESSRTASLSEKTAPSVVDFATPMNDVDSGSPTDTVSPPLARHASVEIEETDGRARNVITGRLVRGHLVDDDFPSSSPSMSTSTATLPGERETDVVPDLMSASIISASSRFSGGYAEPNPVGTFEEGATSEEEEEEEAYREPISERMITLVGNVKDKTVFMVDDMIDKARSWIAAAETVVKRGGAKKVYCIATHGLFGDDCLQKMAECECIDYVRLLVPLRLPFF